MELIESTCKPDGDGGSYIALSSATCAAGQPQTFKFFETSDCTNTSETLQTTIGLCHYDTTTQTASVAACLCSPTTIDNSLVMDQCDRDNADNLVQVQQDYTSSACSQLHDTAIDATTVASGTCIVSSNGLRSYRIYAPDGACTSSATLEAHFFLDTRCTEFSHMLQMDSGTCMSDGFGFSGVKCACAGGSVQPMCSHSSSAYRVMLQSGFSTAACNSAYEVDMVPLRTCYPTSSGTFVLVSAGDDSYCKETSAFTVRMFRDADCSIPIEIVAAKQNTCVQSNHMNIRIQCLCPGKLPDLGTDLDSTSSSAAPLHSQSLGCLVSTLVALLMFIHVL